MWWLQTPPMTDSQMRKRGDLLTQSRACIHRTSLVFLLLSYLARTVKLTQCPCIYWPSARVNLATQPCLQTPLVSLTLIWQANESGCLSLRWRWSPGHSHLYFYCTHVRTSTLHVAFIYLSWYISSMVTVSIRTMIVRSFVVIFVLCAVLSAECAFVSACAVLLHCALFYPKCALLYLHSAALSA
jgi:hypothetical protein